MAGNPSLPCELRGALEDIGARLERRQSIASQTSNVLRLLGGLPAVAALRAGHEISSAAKLYHYWRRPGALPAWLFASPSDEDQLRRVPGLEYLFIFHMDGTLREAALNKIAGGIPNPFLFCAIAWRLNDWAPPVRDAAVRCARRSFPLTSASTIAEAAMVLLSRQNSWGRWTAERAVLAEAFRRADVAAALAQAIQDQRAGGAVQALQYALETNGLDPFLETLAAKAAQPAIRAIALQALTDGRASWPSGYAWQWIDKPMGLRRRVRTFSHRPLQGMPRRAAIAMGLSDRSAAVKKAALDALTLYRAEIPDAAEIARPLLAHRSAPVRERAEYLLTVLARADGSVCLP
jgi:hypothetical protein